MRASSPRTRTLSRALAAALAIVVASHAVDALAEKDAKPSPDDAAAARVLFQEGTALMKKGNYAEACPKLEEGARLNPGIGMRFNLAVCWENIGRVASAWNLYLDVANAAKVAKDKREKSARDAAAKLEPKLSRLTIEVEDKIDGLEIRRNGSTVGEGQLGTAVAVDPGPQTIEASAPDHQPWQTTVDVKPDADRVTVKVPRLVKIEKPKPPPPPPPPPPPGLGTTKTVALVLGGAGVIGLGVGLFFGARAITLNDESKKHCDGNRCNPDGFALRNEARRWGSASTIGIIAGAVGVGTAAVLWFTAPEPRETKTAVRPWVSFDGGGLSLQGAW